MVKIAVNKCYGGFGLSEAGMIAYAQRKGLTLYPESGRICSTYWIVPPDQRPTYLEGDAWHNATLAEREASNAAYSAARISDDDIPRDDPDLIAVIEQLGSEVCSGMCAKLEVVEIPDDVKWQIEEYDGREWIAEVHRTW